MSVRVSPATLNQGGPGCQTKATKYVNCLQKGYFLEMMTAAETVDFLGKASQALPIEGRKYGGDAAKTRITNAAPCELLRISPVEMRPQAEKRSGKMPGAWHWVHFLSASERTQAATPPLSPR